MTMMKNKKQMLAESLDEAINPKPKDRDRDRLGATKSLLSNYRDDQPPIVSDGENTPEKTSAVHNPDNLPSTVVSFERPQTDTVPSTNENVDVLPSTVQNLPSTNEGQNGNVDGVPSTLKKPAVHNSKTVPSTPDRHTDKKIGRFDNRIRKDIIKQIQAFCLKNDITQRDFVEMSAVHFMELWTAKFSKIVDGMPSHDDGLKMMVFKTAPRIINLYRAYNFENKWKFRDDEIASKYNQTDIRVIELGIMQTQFNANFKKINSFEYYKNEIESYIGQNLGGEMLDFLLGHYRQKWNEAAGRELDLKFLEENGENK